MRTFLDLLHAARWHRAANQIERLYVLAWCAWREHPVASYLWRAHARHQVSVCRCRCVQRLTGKVRA
jgi:hypothetical protein